VFVFAHCDDEIFCLPLLLEKDTENTLIFLTSCAKSDINSQKKDVRGQEALRASNSLKRISNTRTLFYNKNIYDGSVHKDFSQVNFKELTRLVLDEKPDELVTLSYEGGHQDHDSVHVICKLISENHDIRMRCFSGYRALELMPRFFSVLKPVSTTERVAFKRLLVVGTAIRLMVIYTSQFKTWIGLAPFLLVKYSLFPFWESKNQALNGLNKNKKCFYESRGRAKQCQVLESHESFVVNFKKKS
jgi:LmbE family N-acetylglucosaminyl deacetylase